MRASQVFLGDPDPFQYLAAGAGCSASLENEHGCVHSRPEENMLLCSVSAMHCAVISSVCLLDFDANFFAFALQRKNGEASPEWVFVGGELLPDEVERAFAKDGKDVKWKNLSLAAVRTAALDLVSGNEMPETDFGKFGGNKERLPPSLLNMTR